MNLICMLFLRYAMQDVNLTDLLLLHLIFAVHMKTCEFNKTVCRFSYLLAPPKSAFTPQPPTRCDGQSGSRTAGVLQRWTFQDLQARVDVKVQEVQMLQPELDVEGLRQERSKVTQNPSLWPLAELCQCRGDLMLTSVPSFHPKFKAEGLRS